MVFCLYLSINLSSGLIFFDDMHNVFSDCTCSHCIQALQFLQPIWVLRNTKYMIPHLKENIIKFLTLKTILRANTYSSLSVSRFWTLNIVNCRVLVCLC